MEHVHVRYCVETTTITQKAGEGGDAPTASQQSQRRWALSLCSERLIRTEYALGVNWGDAGGGGSGRIRNTWYGIRTMTKDREFQTGSPYVFRVTTALFSCEGRSRLGGLRWYINTLSGFPASVNAGLGEDRDIWGRPCDG